MKALEKKYFEDFGNKIFNLLTNDEMAIINLSAEDTLFTRYTRAKIRQVTEVEQAYAYINLIKGNKSVNINLKYTGIVEDDFKFATDKINEARKLLEVLNDDPYLVFPVNNGVTTYEANPSKYSSDELMDFVAESSMGLDLAGLLTDGTMVRASMNSKGQNHWFKTQGFIVDYSIYNLKQKAVKSLYAGSSFDPVAFKNNLNDSKLKLDLLERDVKKMPKGEYRVYLAPGAVSELVNMLSWNAVSMSAHKRGSCTFKDYWKGEKNLSNKFTLQENFEIGLAPKFNDKGEISPAKVEIFKNGEFRNFLTNSRTAKEFDLNSNFASESEGLRSAEVLTGNLQEKNILKTIGEGLYISDLHYLNWSDRDTARITGMTRYACFYVKNGELVSPIEDLRFDESYNHIFGDGLVDLTSHSHIIPSTSSYFEREIGGCRVPGIVVNNFKFTL